MRLIAAADPQDTFFNGKLYVSNQDGAFSTVLVTHSGGWGDGWCALRHARASRFATRTRARTSPCNSFRRRLAEGADRDGTFYYQNYFDGCGS